LDNNVYDCLFVSFSLMFVFILMVALWNRADHYILPCGFFFFFMAALWNTAGHYIFMLWFLSIFFCLFFLA